MRQSCGRTWLFWLFPGKNALLKRFANIAIDSESNLEFATKAAGSEKAWTSAHTGTLRC